MDVETIVGHLEERKANIETAIDCLNGVNRTRKYGRKGKRTMSAAGRRKIAAAQRARWARVRAEKKK